MKSRVRKSTGVKFLTSANSDYLIYSMVPRGDWSILTDDDIGYLMQAEQCGDLGNTIGLAKVSDPAWEGHEFNYIGPGEFYITPLDNIFHDATTEPCNAPDISFAMHGHFSYFENDSLK